MTKAYGMPASANENVAPANSRLARINDLQRQIWHHCAPLLGNDEALIAYFTVAGPTAVLENEQLRRTRAAELETIAKLNHELLQLNGEIGSPPKPKGRRQVSYIQEVPRR